MNNLFEIALILVILSIFFISNMIQKRIETSLMFKIKLVVGIVLISWSWIDYRSSTPISILITLVVAGHIYSFYKKNLVKNTRGLH